MNVRKKRLMTWLLAFCMTLSVLAGMGPTGFLLQASVQKAIVSGNEVTFTFSTPSAYGVYLAGDFNGWNEKPEDTDKGKTIPLTSLEGDKWQVTLNTDDYPSLAQSKNGYKFVIYTELNGTAHWEDGPNHSVYRKDLIINGSSLNVVKGESMTLPDGIYYNQETQEEESISASNLGYALKNKTTGITINQNQLTVEENFLGSEIVLEATYQNITKDITVNVLGAAVNPIVRNADGTITFNMAYSGETLYYVGDLTSWGSNQKLMDKKNGIFTYTTETPVLPGKYAYKFKPNADDWNGDFNAEGTPGGANSQFIVEGIVDKALTVEKGKVLDLPETVDIMGANGETKTASATYSLMTDVAGVTLKDNKLEVPSEFTGSTLSLKVGADSQEAVFTVQVVSQLNTYTIHYLRTNKDYEGWNLWLWETGKNGSTFEFDEELTDGSKQYTHKTEANPLYIRIKKGDWTEKDVDLDRKIEIPAGKDSVEVWLIQGDETIYYSRPDSSDRVKNAFMDSPTEVLVNLSSEITNPSSLVLKDEAGQVIKTTAVKINESRVKLTITDGTAIDVRKLYKVESPLFKAAKVQMRGILDDPAYFYEGDDLGLTYTAANSTFKLWAPTATSVKVSIYDTPEEFQGVETTMNRLTSGVWTITLNGDLKGKYYYYVVAFEDGTINYVVDPYAKAVSINGGKGAIVDLEETDPVGFNPAAGPRLENATDAIVYELHVRDMSSETGNSFDAYEGKYLAFTKKGLKTSNGQAIGIDHLKELGITHVQLQPMYDYATVDEAKLDSYNWGYDPQNYNVPEGSYATDPSNPTCRINEAKQMIAAFHKEGIGVIMDVVYNHTFNVATSSFEQIVPGYYYRMDDNGNYTNGSGCSNEVASEKPMVRKFIKDSVKYWATEYGMDGFRFDLMGLIDTETMKQITKELKEEVNPNIIIYGEPWTGGSSGLASESQTLKGSQKGSNFGVFNDNIRGAIKGDSDGDGTGFATGSTGVEKDIVEGVQGAINTIATNPTEVVTYITAHDNLNLWDKVLTTMHLDTATPYSSLNSSPLMENEAVKRDILANGIVFTSQGISFMHAGEEILRSKYGDSNSYKSSDEINKIRWKNKDNYTEVFDYYKGLIALRKAHPAFRMASAQDVKKHFEAYKQNENVVAFTLKDYANGDSWKNIVVIYNADQTSKVVDLPSTSNWNIVVNETKAGTTVLKSLSEADSVEVAPLSMMVLYDEAMNYTAVPTSIAVTDQELGMAVGNSKLLKVTVKDQNQATMLNQSLNFTSTDEKIVTVSSNGKVTAKAVGEAEIVVSCGQAETRIKVTVVSKLTPKRLVLTGSKEYVYESKTLQLTATVYDQFDKEMLDAKVSYGSSDKAVATVDAYGKVIGLTEGQAIITATAGEITESYTVYVKPYEKRYIIFEYIREDEDYTDWNLWTWNTGVADGQVDFTTYKDGKATAYIEIGPETQGMGFILRKGTDWSTCKQDITADRYVYTDTDQILTKARVYTMVNDVEVLKAATAPVIDPENDLMTFYYRNNALFKAGTMANIQSVQVEINDKLYEMRYDSKNEIFSYDYKGLEEGKYYYRYHITYEDGSTATSLDSNNNAIEKGMSVIAYQKYDLTVSAKVAPGSLNYRESSLLNVEITYPENEKVNLKKIVADLSQLGGASEAPIDLELKALALSVTDEVAAGVKQIPIKVYDVYGNIYKTVVEVEVTKAAVTSDFDFDEAVIYFMLTDRFNNGDASNDDPLGIGYDKNAPGAYHGGDFKGITEKLNYLKDLGINTIWISPIVEQIGQNIGSAANCYYAYHGYWAKDFEALNPNFGSLEDLKELIDAAHEQGIKIMVDVVINHAGYGLKEGETSTDSHFPTLAEQMKYAGMFRTDGSTDTVYGEISGMPDFKTEIPEVRNTVLNWQTAWIEKCTTSKGNTIDYFRIDTAKHVDLATLQALKIATTKVKPDFKYILEAWFSGADLDAYLNRGFADSVLNFDFKDIAKNFVKGNLESAEASLEALNKKATSSASYGNFLGSHDEDGFLYSIGKENVGGLKTAATLQATSKGQPVIYYGEEIGLSGANNYPQYDNRYDMNWEIAEAGNDILSHYQKLFNIRKNYSKLFAKGSREMIAGSDKENFIAFTRAYNKEHIVVAINNGAEQTVSFKVPFKVGSMVTDIYNEKTYSVSSNGNVELLLPAAKAGGTVILKGITEAENTGSSDDSSTGSSGVSTSGSSNSPTTVTKPVENEIILDKGYTKVTESQSYTVTDTSITVEVPLTQLSQVDDLRKLGAYYIDETGKCIYVGGHVKGDNFTYVAAQSGNYVLMTYDKTFTDVTMKHWAKEYIDVLAAKHILEGKDEEKFDPADSVTRAEFAAMLSRALNLKAQAGESFKDVTADSWYSAYVSELKALGLITGYKDNSFRPNQKITRQEMAVLMARVHAYLTGEALTDDATCVFSDAKDLAIWARNSVRMAQTIGIIEGNTHHEFLPHKTATRAETAKMLFKLLEVTKSF